MKKKLFEKPLVLVIMLFMFLGILPIAAMAADGAENPTTGFTTLAFGSDTNGTSIYGMTPSFSNVTKEYAVTVPDYSSSFNIHAVSLNADDKIMSEFVNLYGATSWMSVTSGQWSSNLPVLVNGNNSKTVYMHVGPNAKSGGDPTDTVYTINVLRSTTLSKLTVNDTICPAFNRDRLNYTAGVAEDATTVSITPTAFASGYTLTVNGAAATSGTAAVVTLNWDANGKMEVPIVVSGSGLTSTTYTVTLIKETKGDTPVLSMQPQGATYLDTATSITALKVKASANGTVSYQWYSNTATSTENSTKIDGATADTYTPVVANVGTTAETKYYYCVVTNTKTDNSVFTTSSDMAAVTVKPDPTPTVTIVTNDGSDIPAAGYSYNVGDTKVTTLKVNATTRADGGTWVYKWKRTKNAAAQGTYDAQTYTPQTTADRVLTLTCTVSYVVDGVSYSGNSTNSVTVTVNAISAMAPSITTQPLGIIYPISCIDIFPLRVAASTTDGGVLTYQWCSSTDNKTFTNIDSATQLSYKPETSDKASTTYYYCKITNTVTSSNGNIYATTSKTSTVAVGFKSIADLGGTWSGDGTQDSPYLIQSQSDLVLLRDLVNSGITFIGYYFKLTADITLPEGWMPIGGLKPGQLYSGNGLNILPFSATLDGDNHTITVPEGGLPLFGYVRSATVKNLNIYGKKIAGYGLVNCYTVDYGPTADYGDYTAAGYGLTINIDNVTLKSGSSTQMAGFIGGYASGANSIYINDSTVESGVVIGYNKDQSEIGSFVGGFSGTVENCVSYATVYGVNYVGGIVGDKGQSMGYCSVMDSAFHGTLVATGNYAGGIFGNGYNSGSAPNTPCVSIQNCYSDGSITGLDYVGGILGGEPACKQCWANGIGYVQNNCFVGTVTATKVGGTSNIGGIIGYMTSLDRYNIISNNYYQEGCGATKGIGAVGSVDSSTGGKYGRTDDPTGVGADKLTKSVTAAQLKDGTVLALLNSGLNSSGNWIQGDNYPVFGNKTHLLYLKATGYKASYVGGAAFDPSVLTITGTYSDGTTKSIDNTKISIIGFNSDTKGYISPAIVYDNHGYYFETYITSNADYAGDVAAVKTAVSGVAYTFDMTAANTSDEAKTAIEKEIATLNLNGVSALVAVDTITPAVAGTVDIGNGTNGSFSATVTLSKGTASDTVVVTGVITTTAYDYTNDMAAAKREVIEGTYNYDQTAANTSETVKTEIEKNIAALHLSGVVATVAVDEFTPAVAGTKENASGSDGNYKATVTLTGGSLSDTVAITGTIKATQYSDQPTEWKNPFGDISSDDWYYSAVKYACGNKLFYGTSDTQFDPNNSMTRAMLVTVLYRLDGKTTVTGKNGFTDVPDGQWYTDAVVWASDNKIVAGYGDGLFGTNDSITREQMAVILYNYSKYKGNDVSKSADLSAFSDASNLSSWAVTAMQWAVGQKLIAGTTTTTLSPDGNATRAQVAAILMRFTNK